MSVFFATAQKSEGNFWDFAVSIQQFSSGDQIQVFRIDRKCSTYWPISPVPKMELEATTTNPKTSRLK